MNDNPLLAIVFKILKKYIDGISEYQLVKVLESVAPGFKEIEGDSASEIQFRKHFMVMNSLFTLQSRLVGKGVRLAITPLKFKLVKETYEDINEMSQPGPDSRLREYYLDWGNYDIESSSQIKALLSHFWERYLGNEDRVLALDILGLPVDARWESVKHSYRRLAAIHHPDRGGETVQFNSIREAYEYLHQVKFEGAIA